MCIRDRLMPVRPLDEVVSEFSRFYMYVFEKKDDADTFGFMVSKFMIKTCLLYTSYGR